MLAVGASPVLSQGSQPAQVRVMLSSERIAGFSEHTKTMLGLFDTTRLVVERDRFLAPGSRRDPLQALVGPARREAEGAPFPGPKEPVVMVEIDGHAVAYPLGVLTYHSVVNDTIGAVPVTVWYDPISNGMAVFRRDPAPTREGVARDPLELRVAGLLLHGSSVLYDRASKALFSPIEGRGLSGAYAGSTLEFLPYRIVSFEEFRSIRRAGEVIERPRETSFDYSVNPYADFQTDPSVVYMQTTTDQRAHPKTPGIGVAGGPPGSEAHFVPYIALRDRERTVMTDAGPVVLTLTPEGTVHVRECPPGAVVSQAYFANWVSAHTRSAIILAIDVRDLPSGSPR